MFISHFPDIRVDYWWKSKWNETGPTEVRTDRNLEVDGRTGKDSS